MNQSKRLRVEGHSGEKEWLDRADHRDMGHRPGRSLTLNPGRQGTRGLWVVDGQVGCAFCKSSLAAV